MKKKMIALVAGALMALSTTSAFAAFENMDLIRVVYQKSGGTTEIASELGNVASLIATQNNTVGDALSADQLNLANAYVTYFAINKPTKELWITGIETTKIGSLKTSTVSGLADYVWNEFNKDGGTAGATTVVGSTTDANSFKVRSMGQGTLANAITVGFAETEVSLAELASGPIMQDLYYFSNYGTSGTGTKVGQIWTNSDGTTSLGKFADDTATNTTTPVPAAVYLFGSGLLGLAGVRRMKN
jgi:hypothetical protein